MTVDQIRIGSDNFAYLIYGRASKKAAVVDPGMGETKIEKALKEKGLELEYIILTHHHYDHTTGAIELRDRLGGRIFAHQDDAPMIQGVDATLFDGEVLKIGDIDAKVIHTPGHTPGGICLLVTDRYLLTGDTLFINECGRCDLPGSSIEDMFLSLKRLGSLPDDLIVYPGHDYGPIPSDTLGNQNRTNYTMKAKTVEEFMRL
jgi:hydroxyacylglutathione hydrolase